MKFNSEEKIRLFIEDKPFYENSECFCLGNTLEQAGEIIRKIVSEKENENVGMDIEGIE